MKKLNFLVGPAQGLFTAFFIATTLLSPIAYADGANVPANNVPATPPEVTLDAPPLKQTPDQLSNPETDSAIDDVEEKVPALGTAAQQWADQQEGIAEQLLVLRAGALEKYESLKAISTPKEMETYLEKGAIKYEVAGFGSAEVTTIDGMQIVKVVPHQWLTSYLFVKKNEVNPLSRHLRVYVARQHVDPNIGIPVFDADGRAVMSPWTGRQRLSWGRNNVVVWLDEESQIDTVDPSLRPTPASPRWWADMFYAKYKKVSSDEVSFGIASGTLQGAATALVCALKAHLDHTGMDWAPVVASAAFGSFVNMNLSTYKNWAYRGPSRLLNAMKASTVSIGFNMSMVLAHQGMIGGMKSMNFASLNGAEFDGKILGSAVVNNWTKNGWFKATNLRTTLRINSGSVRFKIFQKEYNWNKSNIENAFVYLIPFSLKQIDLFFFANYPVMQTLGYPVGEAIGLWYVKSLAKRPISKKWLPDNSEKAKMYAALYEADWNESILGVLTNPLTFADWFKRRAKTISTASSNAMDVLGRAYLTMHDSIFEKCAEILKFN